MSDPTDEEGPAGELQANGPKLYVELAPWWPLLSQPEDVVPFSHSEIDGMMKVFVGRRPPAAA